MFACTASPNSCTAFNIAQNTHLHFYIRGIPSMLEPHPAPSHKPTLHCIQCIEQNRILNRIMDIRNPINALLSLRRPHPRIHLRQRRRAERVVIAQQ